MVDKSPIETDALNNASVMGGEYLESIHKTDLMTMTADEWMTFINVICTGWEDGKLQADSRLGESLEWAKLDLREVTGTPPKPPF